MTQAQAEPFYILSLDGGGSLGVYTLGVLERIEALVQSLTKKKLHEQFGLIYGTSTGSIIGSLLALGFSIEQISDIYDTYVPNIMNQKGSHKKSLVLRECATKVFGDKKFNDETFKTLIGVVTTRYNPLPRPMIFKSSAQLAHRGRANFVPGFGCNIADAVIASCSAKPFFKSHKITMKDKSSVEVIDGGFVANNPTLFAITDAKQALNKSNRDIRVLSLGVGNYLRKSTSIKELILQKLSIVADPLELFETTLAANNNATEELRKIVFPDVVVERVSHPQTDQEYATNFLESNPRKLNQIKQWGSESFRQQESGIIDLFSP